MESSQKHRAPRSPVVQIPVPRRGKTQKASSAGAHGDFKGAAVFAEQGSATAGPSSGADASERTVEDGFDPTMRSRKAVKRRYMEDSSGDEEPRKHRAREAGPKMTKDKRDVRWPPRVRLSIEELRILQDIAGKIVPVQCRHDIAPYAFNSRNDAYREFVIDGILSQTEESATRTRRLSRSRHLAERVEEAAQACRRGAFSQDAVAHATRMARRAFEHPRSDREEVDATAGPGRNDDEVQIVDPELWKVQVRLARVETAVRHVKPSAARREARSRSQG
ncbi:uncharacterized protein BKCO1_3800034 [Diplodia corticola]|uniref:Uncharacterized protein n=1 Tax=Diplodia corticola TaxID=236234 RepID=A0A1J9QWU4_9PEZI|nr:uncharacterized protein BKCO1_3800034 [Diplodia corticola]OJD32458.1 hypothetical protein BKCO1_3800034 [Diplodia corticola]